MNPTKQQQNMKFLASNNSAIQNPKTKQKQKNYKNPSITESMYTRVLRVLNLRICELKNGRIREFESPRVQKSKHSRTFF